MKPTVKQIRKQRTFSEEFKHTLVTEYEKGKFSVGQLGSLYQIRPQIIYRWIYKYSMVNKQGVIMVEKSQSSTQKLKDMEKRIAELERAVGQKQIKIDFLEKMIDIAKEELNIDIKKNSNTSQSAGSEPAKKK